MTIKYSPYRQEHTIPYPYIDQDDPYENPDINKTEKKVGWICPKCGKCLSPYISECPICNNNYVPNTPETPYSFTCFVRKENDNPIEKYKYNISLGLNKGED
jgi:uncharacterized OB-fold protein